MSQGSKADSPHRLNPPSTSVLRPKDRADTVGLEPADRVSHQIGVRLRSVSVYWWR